MKKRIWAALALAGCIFLAGCGGAPSPSSSSSVPAPAPSVAPSDDVPSEEQITADVLANLDLADYSREDDLLNLYGYEYDTVLISDVIKEVNGVWVSVFIKAKNTGEGIHYFDALPYLVMDLWYTKGDDGWAMAEYHPGSHSFSPTLISSSDTDLIAGYAFDAVRGLLNFSDDTGWEDAWIMPPSYDSQNHSSECYIEMHLTGVNQAGQDLTGTVLELNWEMRSGRWDEAPQVLRLYKP